MLFHLLLFLIIAGCFCNDALAQNSTNCPCGWANRGRIVGGQETLKNEYPWMAAVWADDYSQVACGATIVTRQHAVTAGHCEEYIHKYRMVLLVGAHDVSDLKGATKVEIEKIILHPDYQIRGEFSDDIALIVTKTVIPFSTNVGPACLPTGPIDLDYEKITSIGWGQVGYYQKASQVLLSVDLKVVPHEICRQHWRTLIEPKSQICGLHSFNGVCRGDSGGPLVWLDPETRRYTLVGIPSYVRLCVFPPPSVFTEVGVYIPWLRKTIQENKPEQICTKA